MTPARARGRAALALLLVTFSSVVFASQAQSATDNLSVQNGLTPESTHRHFAIIANPLALLFGVFGGELHWAASSKFVLGVGFQTADASFTNRNTQIYEYGLSAAYHLDGQAFETSWSIRSAIRYMPVENISTITGVESLTESVVLTLTLNRQWSWGKGFNASLGLGAALDVNNPERRFQPRVLAQMGWAW